MKTTSKKSSTQFVVLFGNFDASPEEVEVSGIFSSLQSAQKFVREEYLAAVEEEEEDENPDLDFVDFCDDGHSFWKIEKVG